MPAPLNQDPLQRLSASCALLCEWGVISWALKITLSAKVGLASIGYMSRRFSGQSSSATSQAPSDQPDEVPETA